MCVYIYTYLCVSLPFSLYLYLYVLRFLCISLSHTLAVAPCTWSSRTSTCLHSQVTVYALLYYGLTISRSPGAKRESGVGRQMRRRRCSR